MPARPQSEIPQMAPSVADVGTLVRATPIAYRICPEPSRQPTEIHHPDLVLVDADIVQHIIGQSPELMVKGTSLAQQMTALTGRTTTRLRSSGGPFVCWIR